ncbi:MAG: Gfo/Idh/MocA family oxidoreductase [Phycisphaerae bacterium]|nr:Gfo/Idh/MocA family oxidoreductase [Phycisphaerae bacterium]NIP53030.1 Gfo/Idh/MocA family oxidoreductase [Phycisphaerae bacterium]NIS53689.1 Gfo/Idh/MocA family oxidoreductase [Phycisphaerae bacterium]NIU11252.1 Gfo/Idh/MocA family oxidoreductase [Phycisphaerae bacterium]NIU57309.1 Gfo/Idh/MocA family oxidoreductase [Phycisphaerae bacterium]
MKNITRRDFVKSSIAGGLTLAAPFSRARGANDDLRVAVAGIRGRGGGLVEDFHDADGVRVVALCDVDEKVLESRIKRFKDRNEKVDTYIDCRKMLEDKSINIVAIATPDHWHVPLAAWSVVAGKDVYVEKPLSHTISEGRLLVNLARKHKRIVQHGTQARSSQGIKDAIEYMKSGELGKIRMAKAINSQRRGKIGREPDSPAPPHVHYDLWLGPAPKRPFNRFHYKWHWWWDYGTGDTGNDGIHQIDIARWGLGVELPKAISCSGGQLWYDDDHETPDTQIATFEYDDVYLMYEMRLWTPYPHEGHDNGNIFYGDNGKVSVGRRGWQVIFRDGKEGPGGGRGGGSHTENFIKAVRTRKISDLNADVEVGHHSAALCHMANIAMRVGRRLKFDAQREKFIDDSGANEYLTKHYRKGYELPTL